MLSDLRIQLYYFLIFIQCFDFCCSENDRAFDILYCITFKLMDQQWLDMHATYMDFNVCSFLSKSKKIQIATSPFLTLLFMKDPQIIEQPTHWVSGTLAHLTVLLKLQTVMKSTRRQLERELLIEDIQRIEDMPSYRLLGRQLEETEILTWLHVARLEMLMDCNLCPQLAAILKCRCICILVCQVLVVSGNLISENYKVEFFFPGDRMPSRVTEVSDQLPWQKIVGRVITIWSLSIILRKEVFLGLSL